MRKLLFGGFAVFAGAALQPGTLPDQQPDYSKDPRYHALYRFFGKTGCPAQRYTGTFLQAADDYSLDWRLLPSLSFIESTGGKAARHNNFFGWDNGNARFDNPAAGIHTVGYRLATSELYRNKELDELLATYNSNSGYGQKVKAVMRRIAPAE
jgi:hypothetical protein